MYSKKEKTDQEWSKIRFQNSVGPAVGGLIHDVSTLVATRVKPTPKNIEKVKKWLNILWEIAEQKKKELTQIKPVDKTKANKDWDKKKQEIYNKDSQLEDKETEVRENQQQKWGPDNLPTYKEE